MSGDVQPRKRKDKKRKRDSLDRKSEGEIVFTRKQSLQDDEPREQHQGVHGSKMGSDDVHLHVQGDHETGGHWCAKLFFFSLLAILLGLVGLIILENRGLSDLDTPLSESRFSNYFDGWVDEHRESHDEHDAVSASIEEHEHEDEPFEEEEDHSEADEADDEDEEEKDHEDDDEDEKDTNEDEEEEEAATEEVEADTAEEDDETREEQNQTAEEEEEEDGEGDEDADGDNKTVEETVEETQEDEDEKDNDEEEDKDNDSEEKNEEAIENEDDDDDTAEEVQPIYSRSTAQSTSHSAPKDEDDDDDEPFEEEEDDGTFESLESVVDNDAEELLLLQEKARQQQANAKKDEPQPEKEQTSYTSSLAVKFGVGVALALVARLVLIRKNPTTNDTPTEDQMKRRLTIASPEDTFAEDADELLEYDYSEDDLLNRNADGEEEDYVEEEVEEEEEIEVTDDEYEQRPVSAYVPETFEELHSMYRPKRVEPSKQDEETEKKEKKESPPKTSVDEAFEPKITKSLGAAQQSEPNKPTQLRFGQYHRENTPPKSDEPKKSLQTPAIPPPATQKMDESKKPESYADDPEEEVEYDDEDMYDDEMLDEEEEEDVADDEGDEDDLSDVDDAELMNRLEAKYGRLPTREYESDDDVDDQSWTKIKSRGGGPQSMDDEAFEEELRRANEEMLQERYNSALTMFESLSQKYPDKHEAFLGKARVLDKLSEIRRSNSILIEAINAYKRYLAFAESILDDRLLAEVAQHCIDRMRFIGLNVQAVPIHEMLIERFPKEVDYRNQLAVTYLLINRLSDAKSVLREVLQRWPTDGYALVHYGFVLRNLDQNLELAVQYLRRGIDTHENGTQDGRFYFHLGDSLLRLGRITEAREIYRRGAKLKLFPSEYQRSLYNVKTLKAQAFWSKEDTGYEQFFNQIEINWQQIRDEGLSVLNSKGVFQDETENLRDQGDWKQFELFSRGQRRQENCMRTPFTCGIVETFPSARYCKRGQVKFSVMLPGTHVWPHCGPTNCRLRAHLGLKVPPGTELRVAEERRSWKEGTFLIFDDSFEHEVWHNGTSLRLVLIVDFWHPELTEQQRRSLTPI